ncbi:MAG: cytochrome c biogenesis CcdA family protein [Candidatus Gracilibacteria bacterium]|nr:cytochrome c biogenesis CcdA family protein [Candidatus Gracilibacteria bacterium]
MKKISIALSLLLLSLLFIPTVSAQYKPKADYFWGIGCNHCAVVAEYLDEHPEVSERINLQKHEIYQDRDGANLFNQMAEDYAVPMLARGVPTMFAGPNYYSGPSQIIAYFEQFEGGTVVTEQPGGNGSVSELTLTVLIIAAAADSINPCTFAVLILLMAAIMAAGGKRRALLTGLTFTLSVFISYYLMGLGLYGAIASAGTSLWFMRIVGVLAILIGLFNIKDFFWYGKGFKMEVPDSWRPLLKRLIKSITGPIGGFFIGFLCSLFLLPCTSGPYIVVLGMLGHKESFSEALWLLALYNLIFILPMLGISFGIYWGMDIKKVEAQRRSKIRILHLIMGLAMLAIGVWVLMS